MIGQEDILNKLKEYSTKDFPGTILLTGEYGCGKHTLAAELAKYYNVDLIDITDKLSLELISEINMNMSYCFYLINLDLLSDNKISTILKLCEEPIETSKLILISSNVNGIMDTILSRCIIFNFKPYTKEELFEFTSDENLLKVCKTPGQILSCKNNYTTTKDMIDSLITNIENKSIYELFKVADYINLSDSNEKVNLDVFINLLKDTLYSKYLSGCDWCLNLYNIVNKEHKKILSDIRLNKAYFLYHLLLTMRGSN